MPRTLRFLFDYVSAPAYLASTQIRGLAARHACEVEAVPVLLAGMLDATGSRGPAENPLKREYIIRDMARLARTLGVPIAPPATHPFNPLVALRATGCVADRAARWRVVEVLYRAAWVEARRIDDAACVQRVAAETGIDGAALVERAGGAEAKARLRRATEEAVAAGAFGVPTVIVAGDGDSNRIVDRELFWGVDSLPALERFLAGEKAADAAGRAPDQVPRDALPAHGAMGHAGCLGENTLAGLVEGRLDPAKAERAHTHLAECPECGRAVRELVSASRPRDAGPLLSETQRASRAGDLGRVLDPGARIGRYEIMSRVGAGAMGVVYAARDPALDRAVALKLLRHDGPGTSPDVRGARLAREGRAMARLSHPNVVAVYDVGEHDGRVFVAMELIRGRTMREWLEQRPRSVADILDLFLAAGSGLAAAHQAGLVHRDFKPDNVLVRDDGRPCVTDFGLARLSAQDSSEPNASRSPAAGSLAESSQTRAGALVGTPAYMAPEQLAGGAADARSDLFAFCVALWEALEGQRPFGGDRVIALRASIDAGPARSGGRSRIPPRLRRVLEQGLRADPSERPASMAALLGGLEAARRAAPWSRIAAGARWPRSRRPRSV
jgi:2-hydroxychromene-2-carboxylate isomerase